MTAFILAPAARQDLRELIEYVAADSPAAADRLLAGIYDAFETVAGRPGMGHQRADLTDQPWRFWTVLGRYTLVYRPDDRPIEFARVLGPGRDVAAILRSD